MQSSTLRFQTRKVSDVTPRKEDSSETPKLADDQTERCQVEWGKDVAAGPFRLTLT